MPKPYLKVTSATGRISNRPWIFRQNRRFGRQNSRGRTKALSRCTTTRANNWPNSKRKTKQLRPSKRLMPPPLNLPRAATITKWLSIPSPITVAPPHRICAIWKIRRQIKIHQCSNLCERRSKNNCRPGWLREKISEAPVPRAEELKKMALRLFPGNALLSNLQFAARDNCQASPAGLAAQSARQLQR